MKDPKKAKWLVGSSAVILSGLLLTQMNGNGVLNTKNYATTSQQTAVNQSNSSGKTEKELQQLDWTNFKVSKAPSESTKSQPTKSTQTQPTKSTQPSQSTQVQPTQPTQSTNQGTDRMTQRS